MENIETQICVACKNIKSIVKFDQMITKKAGKIRRKTCRKCTEEGKGNIKFIRNLRAQGLNKCGICDQVKNIAEFYGESWCYCKDCWKSRNKQWALENPETVKRMRQDYSSNHREQIAKKTRDWEHLNRERANLYRVNR